MTRTVKTNFPFLGSVEMFYSFPDGMGSGMGGMGMPPRREVDNEKFYKTLGLEKTATEQEIKKAYRKLAIKHHPDKGGDVEMFKEISRAYEVLSDPEKRQRYDRFGEEGIEDGGATAAQDIFSMFFGGGGGMGRERGPPKGDDVISAVKVTLEQAYSGCVKKLAINKDVLCSSCDGHGGPADKFVQCDECGGSGTRTIIQRMGPMIQHMSAPCQACRTEGKTLAPQFRCKACRGTGTKKERKVLEVHITPGCPNKKKIVFNEEADQKLGTTPGDVVFVIDIQQHEDFTRVRDNLILSKEISLKEALCGFKFVLTHLDGRKLLINGPTSKPIVPDQFLCVAGEGMPTESNPFIKGDLFVKFVVSFPPHITEDVKTSLRDILPGPKAERFDENDPELFVHHLIEKDIKASEPQRRTYDDDDDEHVHPGQGVQCRQQ